MNKFSVLLRRILSIVSIFRGKEVRLLTKVELLG